MPQNIRKELERWQKRADDKLLAHELCEIANDEKQSEDAFFRHLEFGTGGLRGVLGVGTNRMNIYTVTRATLGIASYIKNKQLSPVAAIGYDTRLFSREFAERAAAVLASNGIKVFVWAEPLPTPMLSFAVRELSASVGIMITASHNPSKYNGYKVYGSDGCQITDIAADEILREIEKHDYFDGTGAASFEKCLKDGSVEYISDALFDSFADRVLKTSVRDDSEIDLGIKIVYTNLNGTGIRPVSKVLTERGFKNLAFVSEQTEHDGNFPTCPYPNPEIPEALALGIRDMKSASADILIATDPDCDRVGVSVMDGGVSKILTGNEVGILLLDYILSAKAEKGSLPKAPIAVKTIVTTDLAEKIGAKYGVKIENVLTGFKYIGETIGRLEGEGRTESFVFGFEESCGYLGASYVRDKDGVFAALLVSEMAAYYKKRGINLAMRLSEIYSEHGFSVTELRSYTFGGAEGFLRMGEIMKAFRASAFTVKGLSLTEAFDYSAGICGLPKSNVQKFIFDGASLTVRPSGTEPKLKLYAYAEGENQAAAKEKISALFETAEEYLK